MKVRAAWARPPLGKLARAARPPLGKLARAAPALGCLFGTAFELTPLIPPPFERHAAAVQRPHPPSLVTLAARAAASRHAHSAPCPERSALSGAAAGARAREQHPNVARPP
eukprot:1923712-Prymnesium_polylepis.2